MHPRGSPHTPSCGGLAQRTTPRWTLRKEFLSGRSVGCVSRETWLKTATSSHGPCTPYVIAGSAADEGAPEIRDHTQPDSKYEPGIRSAFYSLQLTIFGTWTGIGTELQPLRYKPSFVTEHQVSPSHRRKDSQNGRRRRNPGRHHQLFQQVKPSQSSFRAVC